ncbi:DUF779 domain-containing protein [Cellulophaga baltica]|uniref:DUF779 domain-containing protein n=1 Tax=Cellulophaga TaxID=104264 RepID=UPI001C07B561|nr:MULTISPECIES: DUF779 domain-containing protein [Cellulophaga]MBU2996966.1 DUF779 domain-containing protein [Cellulophaga baltica]MDO6768364.1 DUF779 domain-containing protein [Cellulophaga sp. 1_MG-2023]
MNVPRVLITDEAKNIVSQLKATHGELMFHQSGGCCDGSAPMCFEKDDLILNENDVFLGIIAGCEFYMSKDQFEYWKHTQLLIDIVEGRGASFSLEIPLGYRFMTKSRLFTEVEEKHLKPISFATT